MGTSQSSKGPGSGIPMVPAWVDNPPPEAPNGDDAGDTGDGDESEQPQDAPLAPPPSPIAPDRRWIGVRRSLGDYASSGDTRSEEHTYELQSLMRKSYAVFCLKKK